MRTHSGRFSGLVVIDTKTATVINETGWSVCVFNVVFRFRELKTASRDALAGRKFTQEIGVDKVDKSLVANFDILNLVPEQGNREGEFVNNRTFKGECIGSFVLSWLCVSEDKINYESLGGVVSADKGNVTLQTDILIASCRFIT